MWIVTHTNQQAISYEKYHSTNFSRYQLTACLMCKQQTYAQQEESEGHLVPVPHEITPDVDQIQQRLVMYCKKVVYIRLTTKIIKLK